MAESFRRDCDVQALATDGEVTRRAQSALIGQGVPLSWIVDAPVGHPAFAAAQQAALDVRLDPFELDMHACRLSPTVAQRLGIGEFVEPC